MARIYLSSTYRDLESHREAAYKQLQRMQHQVVAMEDYVARDDRPADRCIADVLGCDLYVGVFAWRYGYIPEQDNPERRSVTEIEYRAAAGAGIPRLVFLVDQEASWPPANMDSHTGDGDSGAQIRALRKELSADRMVSFFTSPEDLAGRVGAAVHVAGTMADASDVALDLASIVGADVIDQPEMLFSQSYVPYLVERLAQAGEMHLLTIDLRQNDYWWSTRLFSLATLAQEFTAVDWLLFVEQGAAHIGMARPIDVRRALAAAQPELEEDYRRLNLPPWGATETPTAHAGTVLAALVGQFAQRPGGEEALRFLVSKQWLLDHVPQLDRTHVEWNGPMNPLGVYLLLERTTPYVPITQGPRLLKVIDRVGVATEIARTLLKQRLERP